MFFGGKLRSRTSFIDPNVILALGKISRCNTNQTRSFLVSLWRCKYFNFFDAILYYTKCIPSDVTPAIAEIEEKGTNPNTSSTIDRITSAFTS